MVTNLTTCCGFADVGFQPYGFLHSSRLEDRVVNDPNEVVKVQQILLVTAAEVERARERILLIMRNKR